MLAAALCPGIAPSRACRTHPKWPGIFRGRCPPVLRREIGLPTAPMRAAFFRGQTRRTEMCDLAETGRREFSPVERGKPCSFGCTNPALVAMPSGRERDGHSIKWRGAKRAELAGPGRERAFPSVPSDRPTWSARLPPAAASKATKREGGSRKRDAWWEVGTESTPSHLGPAFFERGLGRTRRHAVPTTSVPTVGPRHFEISNTLKN
jgi:hypothetical protein